MRFGVSKKKEAELAGKMRRFSVSEDDITEKFVRSSGSGGQKANKTSCCVFLKHIPTGIQVKCSRERSRSVNRYLARRILVDKISETVLGEKAEKKKLCEKIRRRKRKMSKRAREKVLREKKKQAEKKNLRSRVTPDKE